MTHLPVIDLHCDLTAWLVSRNGDPFGRDGIGCTLPFLDEGHVRLQVMALYTATGPGSRESAVQQVTALRGLIADPRAVLTTVALSLIHI